MEELQESHIGKNRDGRMLRKFAVTIQKHERTARMQYKKAGTLVGTTTHHSFLYEIPVVQQRKLQGWHVRRITTEERHGAEAEGNSNTVSITSDLFFLI